MSQDDLLGPLSGYPRYVKDLVDDANCRIKHRLDGIPAVDGCVTTQDLLQGVGDEALAVIHQLFEQ